MSKPHAIIIGAGFTGTATAHDLALRGFDVDGYAFDASASEPDRLVFRRGKG